jgi:hypothetical protein
MVLWIDQNTFASSLFEKVYKKQGLNFYTLAHCEDFSYLIRDLDPEVIVLDASTVLENLEAFKRQFDETNGLYNKPIILVDPKEGLEFITNVRAVIHRPIDAFRLPQQIRELLAQ